MFTAFTSEWIFLNYFVDKSLSHSHSLDHLVLCIDDYSKLVSVTVCFSTLLFQTKTLANTVNLN